MAILIGIGLACLAFATFWLWFCMRGFHDGRLSWLSRIAMSLSLIAFVYALLRGWGAMALLASAIPPILAAEFIEMAQFQSLAIQLTYVALPVFALSLLACLLVKPLRRWGIALGLVASFAGALVYAEKLSFAAMCRTAPGHGITNFRRNDFFWSFANSQSRDRLDIHASAMAGDVVYHWSYRLMDWYRPPDGENGDWVKGSAVDCPG